MKINFLLKRNEHNLNNPTFLYVINITLHKKGQQIPTGTLFQRFQKENVATKITIPNSYC